MGDKALTVEKRWYKSKEAFWAFVGVFFTILLGAPGIYYTVHEKQPHILYEIVSESEVLDARQPLQQLEIRYKGDDIFAQKKSLRVITLVVRNDGETHIRPDDFDPAMSWGLKVLNGQLVDVPKLVANNDRYLSNNINIQSDTNTLISFHKIIFDRTKYFALELQVLHRDDVDPQLEVLGKIAGIENQSVTRIRKENGASRGFWGEVFGGSYRVQVFRLSFYGILIVFFLIVSLATPEGVRRLAWRLQWKRLRRLTSDYLAPIIRLQNDWERQVVIGLFVLTRGKTVNMKELNSQPKSLYGVFELNGNLRPSVIKLLPLLIHYMENSVDEVPESINRLIEKAIIHPRNARQVLDFTINASVVAEELIKNAARKMGM